MRFISVLQGGTKDHGYHLRSMGGRKKEVDLTERDLKMDEMSFDSEDICIIGCSVFGGRVPGIALSSLKKASGGSASILVVVYGNRDYDDTLLELKDTVQNAGFRCAAAIAAVAEHSIMRQFSRKGLG